LLILIIRFFQFAATISLVGATFFALISAEPAARATNRPTRFAALPDVVFKDHLEHLVAAGPSRVRMAILGLDS